MSESGIAADGRGLDELADEIDFLRTQVQEIHTLLKMLAGGIDAVIERGDGTH